MTKTLLIKAPYLEVYRGLDEVATNQAPLGLAYIAAVLRKAGYPVNLIDPENQDMTYDDVASLIRKEKPDIVGISAATANFVNAVKLAKLAREAGVPIVAAGGIHATSLPEEVLDRHPEIDIVVIGEGEQTMLDLCRAVEGGGEIDYYAIPGLAFRGSTGEIKKSPPRPLLTDLDSLPFPARDFLPMKKYNVQIHLSSVRGVKATMISSRGCPNHCIFCAAHLTMGHRYRPRNVEAVVDEMEHLVRDYKAEYIQFYDDTFTINYDRTVRMCNAIIKRGLKVKWFAHARVNTVDEDLLRLMKRAGCTHVSFGIESGNQTILRNIRKGTTLDQARKAVKASQRAGLKTLSTFMIGNPGETPETIKDTIDFAVELNSDIAVFSIMVPLPGTEVYNKYKGVLFDTSLDWTDFKTLLTTNRLALISKTLTHEMLVSSLHTAWKRFYLRPSYLIRQIFRMRSFAEFSYYIQGGVNVFREYLLTRMKPSH